MNLASAAAPMFASRDEFRPRLRRAGNTSSGYQVPAGGMDKENRGVMVPWRKRPAISIRFVAPSVPDVPAGGCELLGES